MRRFPGARRLAASASAALAVVLAAPTAPAQQEAPPVPLEHRLDRGLERPPLPEFRPPPPAPLLPPPPELPPAPERPSMGVAVFVREVRLVGNTVFSDAELDAITRRYEGRAITTEQLLELRDALTRRYVEEGYVNSGAVIPDQDVADGVVTVRIIEGRLGEVRLGGLRALRPGFVEGRIRLGAGPPLNVDALQEQLQLLLTDPSLERLDARLGPGPERGEGRLEVDVVEARRFAVALKVDNARSPSVGEYRGAIEASARNVLGYSDPLDLRLGLTEGLRDAALAYSVPLTARDLRLRFFAEATDADVVEAPFEELNIESETYTVEGGLRWPLVRTLTTELTAGADLARRWSQTSLLGRPFSFSPGVQDGESDVTTLRFPMEWLQRGRDQVLALRSTASVGLAAIGATDHPSDDIPDGQFVAWLGQAQWARRFGDAGYQLIARGDLQLAADPLLPIEQIAIGGLNTVRGYRENVLVRDNGAILSLEARVPTFRLPVPGLSEAPADGMVQLAPFLDIGHGWDSGGGERDRETISSIGLGLLWSPSPRASARLYYGYALDDVPDPQDEGLQDRGIHFEVRLGLY